MMSGTKNSFRIKKGMRRGMPVKLSCLDGIIIRILLKVFAAAAILPHPH